MRKQSIYILSGVIVVTLLVAASGVIRVSAKNEYPKTRLTGEAEIKVKGENVSATTDSMLSIDPIGTPLKGAQITDDENGAYWVVVFSSEEPPSEIGGVEVGWFYITGSGTYRTVATGQIPGETYYVLRDGSSIGTYIATGSGLLDFDLNLDEEQEHLITISCFAGTILAEIDTKPDTFNLASRGTFTAFITLPEGYDVADIHFETVKFDIVETVEFEMISAAKGMVSEEDSSIYVAKFDRQDLAEALAEANMPIGKDGEEITLKITGQVDPNGASVYFEDSDTMRVIDKGEDKGKPSPALLTFSLGQNFGNPFNPDTWIPYSLAEDVDVVIRIYSSSGLLVRTLDLGHKPTGLYTTKDKAAYWDGRNEKGENVSSGIYFYSIQAGDFTAIHKMVMVR